MFTATFWIDLICKSVFLLLEFKKKLMLLITRSLLGIQLRMDQHSSREQKKKNYMPTLKSPWQTMHISWHIECSMLTASPFMIWNSSTGIPSPPPVHLTLFLSTLIFVHISGSSLNINFSIKFFLISQVDLTYACVLFPEKQFIELWPRTGWQELRSRLCRVQSTGIYL